MDHYDTFVNTQSTIAARAARTQVVVPRAASVALYRAWRISRAPDPSSPADTNDADVRRALARRGLGQIIICALAYPPVTAYEELSDNYVQKPWRTLIGTLGHLVFEDATEAGATRDGVREISSEIAAQIYHMSLLTESLAAAAENDVTVTRPTNAAAQQIITRICELQDALGLPASARDSIPDLDGFERIGTALSAGCLYALTLYLAGRPLLQGLDTSLRTRAVNLVKKSYSTRVVPELNGDWQIARTSAQAISRVWEVDGIMREGYLALALQTVGQALEPNLAPVGSMMAMLANAQMGSVGIIFDFVVHYPEVRRLHSIAGELAVLARGALVLAAIKPTVAPYIKALRRDGFKEFDSRKLQRLTALAVDVMRVDQPTLGGYTTIGVPPELRRQFDALIARSRADQAVAAPAARVAEVAPLDGTRVAPIAPPPAYDDNDDHLALPFENLI
jgi:hypothetical protein